MELYNNRHAISGSEIIGVICSEVNYKNLTQRGKFKVLRRGCLNTPSLIDYDSMPERFKRLVVKQYGDPHKVLCNYTFRGLCQPDYKAMQFFADYLLNDGRHLPAETQTEYSNNAMVLNTLHKVVNDRMALRRALGGSTRDVWRKLGETVAQLKTEINHSLPENHTRLREKLKLYQENGVTSLVSGKFLNNNAKKVSDVEQEATMRQLLRFHNNLDNESVSRLYNITAVPMGWDTVTASTVANYRKRWDLETWSGRKGAISFDNAKAMQVRRSAPTYPLYYWTMDGWDVELLYQKTEVDKNGNTRTTYHNRLTVVVVLDPCCKYPVGFAIGTHETPQLIKAALRNAVSHTKELFGEHYKVLQLQTDNYSRKALTPIYDILSEKYTPARVHNAKAKVIEPYFNRINQRYCKLLPNWSGYGIASGSAKQPNTEYLNKIHNSFPDEFGVRHQISFIIDQERALVRDKYVAAFAEMPADDKKPVKMDEFLYLLGETTGYTNRLAAPGLLVTIEGMERQYDTFDVQFRRHQDVDWCVKYNPDNLDQVLVVNAKSNGHGKLVEEIGTIRYLLIEKYVQPMALRERTDGDSEQLKQIAGFNKTMRTEITEGMAQDSSVVREMFENNPRLKEATLAKLLLTDSNGQHKDNRNAARIGQGAKRIAQTAVGSGQRLMAKQQKQLEMAQQRSWQEEQDAYLDSKVDISKYL
jgi:hypothetical protein